MSRTWHVMGTSRCQLPLLTRQHFAQQRVGHLVGVSMSCLDTLALAGMYP